MKENIVYGEGAQRRVYFKVRFYGECTAETAHNIRKTIDEGVKCLGGGEIITSDEPIK